MKPKKTPSSIGTTPKKKSSRLSRAEKKAAKNVVLSIHKRPVICPPDRAGRHPVFRLLGILCRTLVIWLASAGLVIFISDALQFGVPNATAFLTALITVVLVTLFCHSNLGKIIAGAGALGSIGLLAILDPHILRDIPFGFVSLYNAALNRLYNVGYLTYTRFKIDLSSMTSTSADELVTIGVCTLTVLIGVLFTACLAKRVRLVPPTIVATSVLVFILTFNIYSNKIESNLGIALLIVSFASVLVMGAYDRLYHRKDAEHYDTELHLFEDNDRPTLPAEYANMESARASRKKSKADLRKKRRAHTVTVEDEISDYFNTDKKKSKPQKSTDKATARAERRAHREMMKEVRRVKHYDRVTAESRTAMSGFAAAAAMLVCLIAIALPSLLVKGNFNTIDAIDEKVSLARDYVTALLRGDDESLDRLEYGADKDNFKPHSTELEQLTFTKKQIFYIRSRYNGNLYLRGWIGTDYKDGAWQAVDKETLATYQDLFGEDQNPAEDMKFTFYRYMHPDLLGINENNPIDIYLTKFRSNLEYGFVGAIVNVRRVNSPSTMTYFPASYVPQYGLLKFDTAKPHDLTYVNYYDGIYTGRNFDESGVNYATVALAPVMTNRYWITNQARSQALYNLCKEALLPYTAITFYDDGTVSSRVELEVIDSGNTKAFRYTVEKRGEEDLVWVFYHNAEDCHGFRPDYGFLLGDNPYCWVIETEVGTLTISLDGRKVIGTAIDNAAGSNLWEQYEKNWTDEARDALLDHMVTERDYSDFVYATYTGTSGSEAIRKLALQIRAQAHEEDRKTGENIPVNVSLADERNSTNADTYVQRDLLVRNVIDYIITELSCTYTITPDLTNVDPALDGVENFLFNTKEGYCVQYASAVALILRELNIPTRYVEGYVSSGLRKIAGDDFIYEGYVLDDQAHAWVEVYFDGVGWIQYETTPQYYIAMYGTSQAVETTPERPVVPEDTETTPPVDTKPDEETESESESEFESESETDEDDVAAAVTRGGLIGLGVIAAIVLILLLIRAIVSAAQRAEDRRQSVVTQVLESGFGQNTSSEDRREMALSMSDAIHDLLTILNLAPEPGEFRDEYAERLTADLAANQSKKASDGTQTTALPPIRTALDAIAAEEFGHGMTVAEMKAVGSLYLYLHTEVRHRVPLLTRLKLRYIKHKI